MRRDQRGSIKSSFPGRPGTLRLSLGSSEKMGMEQNVWELADENENGGDPDNDRAPPSFVHHESGEPAAQAVGPGGGKEYEANEQKAKAAPFASLPR